MSNLNTDGDSTGSGTMSGSRSQSATQYSTNTATGRLAPNDVSGDARTPGLLTGGSNSTGSVSTLKSSKRVHRVQPLVLASVRHSCQAILSSCVEDLDRAIDNAEDFIL